MLDLSCISLALIYGTIVLIILALLIYLQGNFTYRTYKMMKSVPGPKSYIVIGCLPDLWGNTEHIFRKTREFARQLKTNYQTRLFSFAAINIIEPEDAEIILSSTTNNKKSVLYKFLHPWLGTGLLTSEGSKWHNRRKIMTPSFHFNILQNFSLTFIEQSEKMAMLLEEECNKEYTNVLPYVTDFALHSLCETTMGINIERNVKEIKKYKHAIFEFGKILVHRTVSPWLFNNIIFRMSWSGIKSWKLEKTLHQFTSDVIDERLANWDFSKTKGFESKSGKKRLAMLDLLISQMKEGDNIDYEGIKEEVDTFMFEGHDTTAMGLAFTLLLLANNNFAQNRIVEELNDIFQGTDRSPTFQDLQNMVYLERCLKEAHRIYPPVPFISREALEDTKLSNYTIPKGWSIHIHIYDLHRNTKYWPNPEKFDPDRFLTENSFDRHPFAYIPFSAGPRNCIGQKFAQLEEKAFISAILRKYILEPVDTPQNIRIVSDMILRPRDKIRIKFKKRISKY